MLEDPYNMWNYRKCTILYKKMQSHCSSNLVAATCIDITNDTVDRIGKNKDFPTQPFSSSAIALVEPIDHTMAYALPPYVLSKVPTAYIYEAAQLDMKFCIWGILDGHIIPYAWDRGYNAEYIPSATQTSKSSRKAKNVLNAERPRLFRLTPRSDVPELKLQPSFYVLTVFPGSDYIYHYARMVHQVLEMMNRGSAKTLLEIRRFVDVEASLAQCTGLEHVPIQQGDVVLMGHVKDYLLNMLEYDEKVRGNASFGSFGRRVSYFEPSNAGGKSLDDVLREQQRCLLSLQSGEDFLDALDRIQPGGHIGWCNWIWESVEISSSKFKRVFFLGARYSYWGNLVIPIATSVYKKTDALIYAAKCGTLQSQDHIETIVVPHFYAIVEEPNTSADIPTRVISNRCHSLLYHRNDLTFRWRRDMQSQIFFSGLHVSVPTLVGETYAQRRVITETAREDEVVRRMAQKLSYELRTKKGMSKESIHSMLTKIKMLKSSREMLFALQAAAYEHFDTRTVAEMSAYASTPATPSSQRALLSMDNETSWFFEVARWCRDGYGGGGESNVSSPFHVKGDGRYRFFQAIHRTTDYVRKVEDAAAITHDDLSSEHTINRLKLLKDISIMIYDIIVATTTLDKEAQSAIAVDSAASSSSPRLSWGILSTAQISRKFIAAVASSDASEVIAIATRSQGRPVDDPCPASRYYCGDKAYATLLSDAAVKCVYLPLPNSLHLEWIEAAVRAGKHVLVEKPAVLTAAECDRLEELLLLSAANGIYVSEGIPSLHHQLLKSIIDVCSQPTRSELRKVYCEYSHPLASRGRSCIAMNKDLGGGALYALGCYPIALFVKLCPGLASAEIEISELQLDDVSGVDLSMTVSFTVLGDSNHSGITIAPTLTFRCSIAADSPKKQKFLAEFADGSSISTDSPFFATAADGRTKYEHIVGTPAPNTNNKSVVVVDKTTTTTLTTTISSTKEFGPSDPFLLELQDFENVLLSGSGVEQTLPSSSVHPIEDVLRQYRIMSRIAKLAGIEHCN